MNEGRRINAAVVVCLLGVIFLPAVLYVAGYFALSRTSPGATPDDWCRIYRFPWQAEIFKPAAKVESALTGDTVSTYCPPKFLGRQSIFVAQQTGEPTLAM